MQGLRWQWTLGEGSDVPCLRARIIIASCFSSSRKLVAVADTGADNGVDGESDISSLATKELASFLMNEMRCVSSTRYAQPMLLFLYTRNSGCMGVVR